MVATRARRGSAEMLEAGMVRVASAERGEVSPAPVIVEVYGWAMFCGYRPSQQQEFIVGGRLICGHVSTQQAGFGSPLFQL